MADVFVRNRRAQAQPRRRGRTWGEVPLSTGEIEYLTRVDEAARRRERLVQVREKEKRAAQLVTQRYRDNLKKLQGYRLKHAQLDHVHQQDVLLSALHEKFQFSLQGMGTAQRNAREKVMELVELAQMEQRKWANNRRGERERFGDAIDTVHDDATLRLQRRREIERNMLRLKEMSVRQRSDASARAKRELEMQLQLQRAQEEAQRYRLQTAASQEFSYPRKTEKDVSAYLFTRTHCVTLPTHSESQDKTAGEGGYKEVKIVRHNRVQRTVASAIDRAEEYRMEMERKREEEWQLREENTRVAVSRGQEALHVVDSIREGERALDWLTSMNRQMQTTETMERETDLVGGGVQAQANGDPVFDGDGSEAFARLFGIEDSSDVVGMSGTDDEQLDGPQRVVARRIESVADSDDSSLFNDESRIASELDSADFRRLRPQAASELAIEHKLEAMDKLLKRVASYKDHSKATIVEDDHGMAPATEAINRQNRFEAWKRTQAFNDEGSSHSFASHTSGEIGAVQPTKTSDPAVQPVEHAIHQDTGATHNQDVGYRPSNDRVQRDFTQRPHGVEPLQGDRRTQGSVSINEKSPLEKDEHEMDGGQESSASSIEDPNEYTSSYPSLSSREGDQVARQGIVEHERAVQIARRLSLERLEEQLKEHHQKLVSRLGDDNWGQTRHTQQDRPALDGNIQHGSHFQPTGSKSRPFGAMNQGERRESHGSETFDVPPEQVHEETSSPQSQRKSLRRASQPTAEHAYREFSRSPASSSPPTSVRDVQDQAAIPLTSSRSSSFQFPPPVEPVSAQHRVNVNLRISRDEANGDDAKSASSSKDLDDVVYPTLISVDARQYLNGPTVHRDEDCSEDEDVSEAHLSERNHRESDDIYPSGPTVHKKDEDSNEDEDVSEAHPSEGNDDESDDYLVRSRTSARHGQYEIVNTSRKNVDALANTSARGRRVPATASTHSHRPPSRKLSATGEDMTEHSQTAPRGVSPKNFSSNDRARPVSEASISSEEPIPAYSNARIQRDSSPMLAANDLEDSSNLGSPSYRHKQALQTDTRFLRQTERHVDAMASSSSSILQYSLPLSDSFSSMNDSHLGLDNIEALANQLVPIFPRNLRSNIENRERRASGARSLRDTAILLDGLAPQEAQSDLLENQDVPLNNPLQAPQPAHSGGILQEDHIAIGTSLHESDATAVSNTGREQRHLSTIDDVVQVFSEPVEDVADGRRNFQDQSFSSDSSSDMSAYIYLEKMRKMTGMPSTTSGASQLNNQALPTSNERSASRTNYAQTITMGAMARTRAVRDKTLRRDSVDSSSSSTPSVDARFQYLVNMTAVAGRALPLHLNLSSNHRDQMSMRMPPPQYSLNSYSSDSESEVSRGERDARNLGNSMIREEASMYHQLQFVGEEDGPGNREGLPVSQASLPQPGKIDFSKPPPAVFRSSSGSVNSNRSRPASHDSDNEDGHELHKSNGAQLIQQFALEELGPRLASLPPPPFGDLDMSQPPPPLAWIDSDDESEEEGTGVQVASETDLDPPNGNGRDDMAEIHRKKGEAMFVPFEESGSGSQPPPVTASPEGASLADAFRARHPSFHRRAQSTKTLLDQRRQQLEQRRAAESLDAELAQSRGSGSTRIAPARTSHATPPASARNNAPYQPPPLTMPKPELLDRLATGQRAKISAEEMRERTRRLYNQLPEVTERKRQEDVLERRRQRLAELRDREKTRRLQQRQRQSQAP